jgi:4-amino-4-deoxy-L-arabinose transferase-like glycosyltransferase
VLLLLITGSIGARLFGGRAGVFAAVVLATSFVLPMAARTDGTQLLGSLLAWVGAAGLADALFGRSAGRDLRLIVAYGALAAAFMVAGPLPALWPLLALVLYVTLARSKEGWKRARLPAGLVIMIAVALPWYGAMFERHGAAFLGHVLFFPYAVETRAAWWTGPVLALSFLAIGFFPWSALLPGAVSHAASWWRRVLRESVLLRRDGSASADPIEREVREEGAAHFFIACFLAALVPIALYPGPPLTAALAAMPAAALLCGRFLDHLFEDPPRLRKPLRHATLMLVLVGTVGAVLLTFLAQRIRVATPELRFLATVVFITSWLPFLADFMGRRKTAALALALPVALGVPAVTTQVLPAMEDWLSARRVAEALNVTAPEYASLVLITPPRPSIRLYGDRNIVVSADATGRGLVETLDAHRARDGLAYVAFRPFREQLVSQSVTGPLEIVLRTPTLILARVHPGPAGIRP